MEAEPARSEPRGRLRARKCTLRCRPRGSVQPALSRETPGATLASAIARIDAGQRQIRPDPTLRVKLSHDCEDWNLL